MHGHLSVAIQNKLAARLHYEVRKRQVVDACVENRRRAMFRANRHVRDLLESELLVSRNRGNFELTHELRRIEHDLDRLESEILDSMRETKRALDLLEEDFPVRASRSNRGPSPYQGGGDYVYSFAWSHFLSE